MDLLELDNVSIIFLFKQKMHYQTIIKAWHEDCLKQIPFLLTPVICKKEETTWIQKQTNPFGFLNSTLETYYIFHRTNH